MRGSTYYQTSVLTKFIFQEGAKKIDRINPEHTHYKKIASYQTMKSYRDIWNNFFNYLKEHWKVKDAEQIEDYHIIAYMEYKLEYYPSQQYMEKLSSALGKLETALTNFAKESHNENRNYDFSIRQSVLNDSRDLNLISDNYHNRSYKNPEMIIDKLSNRTHQIAALIQLQGGARLEGVALIKYEQLKGFKIDSITNLEKGIIETKEKGGKVGDIMIDPNIYCELQELFIKNTKKNFKVNYQKYTADIKNACLLCNEIPESTHSFRWSFAQRRLLDYGKAGYKYQESLQGVSHEMKHNRADITTHYLG